MYYHYVADDDADGGSNVDERLFVDDVSLAYHSLLPMDVHGTQYTKLRLVTKHTDTSARTVSSLCLALSFLSYSLSRSLFSLSRELVFMFQYSLTRVKA